MASPKVSHPFRGEIVVDGGDLPSLLDYLTGLRNEISSLREHEKVVERVIANLCTQETESEVFFVDATPKKGITEFRVTQSYAWDQAKLRSLWHSDEVLNNQYLAPNTFIVLESEIERMHQIKGSKRFQEFRANLMNSKQETRPRKSSGW